MSPGADSSPEARARYTIDSHLKAAGWEIQDRHEMNVWAGPPPHGVAVREFAMREGHGFADYLLFVNGKAVGAVEAKKVGHTLDGVFTQLEKYATGLPSQLEPALNPLPFIYASTGTETKFHNQLDPNPRPRRVFSFHRPSTIEEWLTADPLPLGSPTPPPTTEDALPAEGSSNPPAPSSATTYAEPDSGEGRAAEGLPAHDLYKARKPSKAHKPRPSTLRGRLRHMPPPVFGELWPNQRKALQNLEESLAQDRPRSLIQMATGSGKTRTSINIIYRLIRYGGARRVLFLVDRSNLGKQAEDAFCSFRTPDTKRKFNELYNVQRLTSNKIGSSSKVVITTIQRLYSMLKGEPELNPELEEESIFDSLESPTNPQESPTASKKRHTDTTQKHPLPVVYNPEVPIELFDILFVDECHRSIASLWRQVLEYFDAHIIGLTATPAMQTFGFFHQNLVMEYNHENAVADGVNCDFEVYRILTKITSEGSTIETGPGVQIGYRSRKTRQVRWQAPDEDISYDAAQVNRKVVAKDQIRLIIRTFKERLFTEIFPGRDHIPKTVIFAIDDSHAEDIVETVREEFGEGADFCQKITYRTTGKDPKTLIKEFRNSYNPRIAVTVDMIATGTDIKPIEMVMFMRAVRSRVYFEQMKGRGVRIINPDDLQAVTPDAPTKDHFVIVDCVGVCQREMSDSQPLERKRNLSFEKLLELVSAGSTDEDILSSLASRLSRLEKKAKPSEKDAIKTTSGGTSLTQLTNGLVEAIDPDNKQQHNPKDLALKATNPLATNPPLRKLLIEIKKRHEQIIDEISRDALLDAGFSPQAKQRAQQIVQSFEQFIEENKDEIDALQFFYSQPYDRRLHYEEIKALADTIGSPPRAWTPDTLWRAYATLEGNRVRGASSRRLLTDIVSLIRFALRKDDQLIPFSDQVQNRFQTWLLQQQNQGRTFTQDQIRWLEMIRDHIATSLEIGIEDFDYTPFTEQGGLGKARQVFGGDLPKILKTLNEELAG